MRIFKDIQTAGFTVIELLIASTVFAVILLIVTVGILKINGTFFKGVTSINTQDTARSIVDSISQDIQFGGGGVIPDAPGSVPWPNPYAICVGINRYSVNPGSELQDGTGPQSLVKDTPTAPANSPAPCSASDKILNGFPGAIPAAAKYEELLLPKMRIVFLTVTKTPSTDIYTIHIRIAYGDDDLLSDNLDKNGNPGTDGIPDTCNSGAGSQFCSVSDITVSVDKRVTN